MTNTLAGRTAVCLYCKRETASEHASLLDYRGEGSTFATEGCGECGYNKVVHQAINPVTGRPGRTDHEFIPRGPAEKDSYYCGCRGWD